jgi:hypothetical protein
MKRTIHNDAGCCLCRAVYKSSAQVQAAANCSTATLRGGYGFFVQAIILPNGRLSSLLTGPVVCGDGLGTRLIPATEPPK